MPKIVKTNLTDQIFNYLQTEIIKGTWQPGEKLPSENELSEQLGVSRMSLRNAIQRCNAMGLTETHMGEGTFVRCFNLRSYFGELYRMKLLGQDPNQINDLRLVLQIASTRLAFADGIAPEDMAVLERLVQKMEHYAANGDLEEFAQADLQFHRVICELCKNDLLFMIYDALESLMDDTTQKNVARSFETHNSYDQVLNHHREMLESVRNHDIDRFVQCQMESRERSHRYYAKQDPPEKL